MIPISRKICNQCGEQNLVSDWYCWACGALFATSGDAPTVMPRAPKTNAAVVAAVLGVGVLLLGLGIGYLVGRHDAMAAKQPTARTTPAPAISGPAGWSTRPHAPVALPPPVPKNRAQASAPAAPYRMASRAATRPYSSLSPDARQWVSPPARIIVVRRTAPMAGGLRPQPAPRSLAPPAWRATPSVALHGDRPTVRVQNNSRVPIELEMDGPVSQSARIAPGTRIAFPVPAGAYRLTLTGSGRRESWSGIDLQPGRGCTIVFHGSGATVEPG
jgi:hypothetical protein